MPEVPTRRAGAAGEPAAQRPVALVTGAGRRLGRAVAIRLAEAGWDVAAHYRGSHDEAEQLCVQLRELGVRAEGFRADLADEASTRELVPSVARALGRVDAVVNNASLFEYDSAADFGGVSALRHYRVNTIAPVLLAQALHAELLARGARGCVVNLLDQKLWNPNPDHLSYTLSKAALREANTLLAQALAPQLRVVAVAPGMTLGTELIDEARLRELQAAGPLGQGPHAEDIADAVLFALRNPAMSGCELLVDAGQHLQARPRDFAF